jgi:hypothetical protein
MAYIWQRYGTSLEKQERLRRLAGQIQILEAKIFAPLAITPAELNRL